MAEMTVIEAVHSALREELKKFLTRHGVAVAEPQRNLMTERLERELSKMVKQLPELQDFDGLLRKSQRLRKNDDGDVLTSEVKSRSGDSKETVQRGDNTGNSSGGGGSSRQADPDGKTRALPPRSRRNQGPRVAFDEQPGRAETAWIDDATIIINSGHGAYRKRDNNDSRLTYCMFAMGVALDKADIAETADGSSYVDKFVTIWGQS